MPHGDRWQLFGNPETVVNTLLPVALDKGRLVRSYTLEVDEANEVSVSVFRYFPEDHEDMGTVFLCLADANEQLTLASFYLLCKPQSPPVKVASITTEWNADTIDAVVSAQTTDDVSLSYFDPYFPANLKKYTTRKTLPVRLAALAYSVRPASKGISYTPGVWEENQRDDFEFTGTVQSVEILDFLGMTVFVTNIQIHKGASDITCTMYIPSSTLGAGVVLSEGLTVMGTAWMQGFLK
jgi:hypothetical protein